MIICAAQAQPMRGDINANIEKHIRVIDLATFYDVDAIIFPELSLTGYEPAMAGQLATQVNDSRLDVFRQISEARQLIIAAGMPIHSAKGITISMLLYQPGMDLQVYNKHFIHPDEEPYFVIGENANNLMLSQPQIAPSICYELSVPAHAERAHQLGASIYLNSSAKTIKGVNNAIERLAEIAQKYSMTVLLANCIGQNGEDWCAGKSSAWNNNGELLAQLPEDSEGLLILDSESNEAITVSI